MDAAKNKQPVKPGTVETVVRKIEVLPPHSLARTRVREARVTLPRLRFLDGDS